jgi:hypothetical protein
MIEFKNGIDVAVRYDVLRNGSAVGQIYANGTPTITMQSTSELKTSLSGMFHDYRADGYNFLSDRLRPVVFIGDAEYPCGTFVVTAENEDHADGVTVIHIEAYSLLYLLQRTKIEERVYYAAGTLYTAALEDLLITAGIVDYDIEASALTLATDREDWDIGTPYLAIINQLLSEMSYNSAYMDNAGKIVLSKYAAPSLSIIDFTYRAGAFSIIGSDYSRSNDFHSKSNVFKIICSNPDLEAPLTATSENDESSSPFSTVNIGRVLNVSYIDNIASQEALQDKADELKMKSMLSTEEVTFYTAINPEHSVFDVVALDNGDLTGLFAETSWTMPLSAASMMTHTARRALYV